MELQIEPGEVRLGDSLVWSCRTLHNESYGSQVAETERRFADLLSQALTIAEATHIGQADGTWRRPGHE